MFWKKLNHAGTVIETVTMDMSIAFISAVINNIPKATLVFAKFHVMKEVNQAMDKLRQLERKGNELLKNHKYTFLKNKLSPKLQSERDLLLEMFPKLGEGYRLVEMFKYFWDIQDKEQANAYLSF